MLNTNFTIAGMKESVHYYLSDEQKKGSSSAVVYVDMFMEEEKPKYKETFERDWRTLILFSDKGGGDIWNADFQGHMSEICKRHQIQLLCCALPAEHNKHRYDQHGNTAKRDICAGMAGGHIKIKRESRQQKQFVIG